MERARGREARWRQRDAEPVSTVTDRQAEERGRTGWKENFKRDHAFLTWGEGKERRARKGEEGMGEGSEARRGGGWQERKFNLAPDSILKPDSQPQWKKHTHTLHTPKTYRRCEWHRSPFGDFPSSKIRFRYLPSTPTPWVQHRGRFPDKNSQRNYSNTAAFLQGVSADCTGLKRLERG